MSLCRTSKGVIYMKDIDKYRDCLIEGTTGDALEQKMIPANIIEFPDFQKLKEDVEKLRTELSMLVLEKDELQYIICKNLETLYCLKLGALEHKAYEVQCNALRLKRKMELIQAKLNRQEKINESEIEMVLDEEFAEYQSKLNEQIEKMNEALKRSKGEVLTDDENKELKKLYRNVVKKLHPDVNPDISEAEAMLLDNALTAYKNGDLMSLRIIEEMVAEHHPQADSKDVMSSLAMEKERLERMIASVQDNIIEIKSRYPYNIKDIVENKDKEEEKRQELHLILEQYKDMIDIYTARLTEMLR